MELKGIDVSAWQERPDWKKVAASGIAFAILRATEKNGMDTSFEHNYKGCKANGILVGVYKYSYALTVAEIQKEANEIIKTLAGRELDFPVWLDLEYDKQRGLSTDYLTTMIKTFWATITSAGYQFGIYCNTDWYNNVIPKSIKGKYDFWLAAYPASDNGSIQERLRPSAGAGWQYSSAGKVQGIAGKVDMDVFYKDYKEGKEMTRNEAINAVIGIAEEEIGYLEKRTGANLDSKTGNAGSNNYTKYWRDIAPDYQGQPWCAGFVSWCLMKTFGLDTAKKLLKHWPYVYCPTLGDLFTKYANPQVGDIVIFYRGGTFAHTGIVTKVSGDKFWTIEGNTSGASGIIDNGGGVCQKTYYNSQLPGTKFCRPDYGEVSKTTTTKSKAGLTSKLTLQFPEVSKGCTGTAVKMLQAMLGVTADGSFGDATDKAFKAFQKNTRQTADGVCGEKGWTAVLAHMKENTFK